MAIVANKRETVREHGGQTDLLQIVIGGSEVLICSSEIREVVRPLPLTRVPMGPDHILGLANIHGQIVSIIDAGKVSSLPETAGDPHSRTRFLVLRHPVMHVGIWVDEVKRLRKVDSQSLKQARTNSENAVFSIEIDGFLFDVLDSPKLFH